MRLFHLRAMGTLVGSHSHSQRTAFFWGSDTSPGNDPNDEHPMRTRNRTASIMPQPAKDAGSRIRLAGATEGTITGLCVMAKPPRNRSWMDLPRPGRVRQV